jgi:predicted DNA-binding transcriptional regulator YafY
MRRIERLINLIAALLETERPLTADEIRDRIAGYEQPSSDAFRRAFERDKEALRAMGIPLETRATGAFGDEPDAYIIPKEKYYLPDLDLEPDELAALRIAAGAVLGGGQHAQTVLLKLSVDAPSDVWSSTRLVWGADLAAEQPLLGPLYQAIGDKRVIEFDYETADGSKSERTVEPYGLVHRRGNWYVVGNDRSRSAIRAFKVSRMGAKTRVRDETFEVPAGFSAEDHVSLEAWELGDRPVPVTVRFSRDFRWWAEHNLQAETAEGPDGTLDVFLQAGNPDALASWVIGFGGEAQVVEPDDARETVLRRLDAALESARG